MASGRKLAVAIAVSALTACAPEVHVKSSFDPRADFTHYRTFRMLEPNKAVPTGPDVDPFAMQRLRQVTYQSLVARGLTPATSSEAELLVNVQATLRDRVDVYPPMYSYGGYYGGYWSYPYWGYDVYRYTEGVVVIDLIDPRTRAVVWRGVGSRTLDGQSSESDMREVVDEVLDQYPPGAKRDGEE